jgi:hypothetical protein
LLALQLERGAVCFDDARAYELAIRSVASAVLLWGRVL